MLLCTVLKLLLTKPVTILLTFLSAVLTGSRLLGESKLGFSKGKSQPG